MRFLIGPFLMAESCSNVSIALPFVNLASCRPNISSKPRSVHRTCASTLLQRLQKSRIPEVDLSPRMGKLDVECQRYLQPYSVASVGSGRQNCRQKLWTKANNDIYPMHRARRLWQSSLVHSPTDMASDVVGDRMVWPGYDCHACGRVTDRSRWALGSEEQPQHI